MNDYSGITLFFYESKFSKLKLEKIVFLFFLLLIKNVKTIYLSERIFGNPRIFGNDSLLIVQDFGMSKNGVISLKYSLISENVGFENLLFFAAINTEKSLLKYNQIMEICDAFNIYNLDDELIEKLSLTEYRGNKYSNDEISLFKVFKISNSFSDSFKLHFFSTIVSKDAYYSVFLGICQQNTSLQNKILKIDKIQISLIQNDKTHLSNQQKYYYKKIIYFIFISLLPLVIWFWFFLFSKLTTNFINLHLLFNSVLFFSHFNLQKYVYTKIDTIGYLETKIFIFFSIYEVFFHTSEVIMILYAIKGTSTLFKFPIFLYKEIDIFFFCFLIFILDRMSNYFTGVKKIGFIIIKVLLILLYFLPKIGLIFYNTKKLVYDLFEACEVLNIRISKEETSLVFKKKSFLTKLSIFSIFWFLLLLIYWILEVFLIKYNGYVNLVYSTVKVIIYVFLNVFLRLPREGIKGSEPLKIFKENDQKTELDLV